MTSDSRPPAGEAAPASSAELFWAFNRLALQGFGGVLAVTQRELVERLRWISGEQFLEMLSLAQVLPGPNVVNLALMVGDRFFGWRGAAAALSGMIVAPLALVLALAVAYGRLESLPVVSGALRGMGAVAAGLVMAIALRLLPSLRANAMGVRRSAAFAVATFVAIGGMRWPLIWVIGGLGPAAVAIAWRQTR